MDNGMTAVLGVFAGIYLIFLIALIAWGIAAIIANVKLFEKAGVEGWKAIIPFYNTIKISEIATGKKTLGILWIALYAVAIVFYFMQISASILRSSSDYGPVLIFALLYWLFILGVSVVSCVMYFKFANVFSSAAGAVESIVFFAAE